MFLQLVKLCSGNFASFFFWTNSSRFWMLNPSCDINLLKERLNTVSYFVKPDQTATVAKCKEFIKKAKDILAILHRFQVKHGSVNDWVNLYNVRINNEDKYLTCLPDNYQCNSGESVAEFHGWGYYHQTKGTMPPASLIKHYLGANQHFRQFG